MKHRELLHTIIADFTPKTTNTFIFVLLSLYDESVSLIGVTQLTVAVVARRCWSASIFVLLSYVMCVHMAGDVRNPQAFSSRGTR